MNIKFRAKAWDYDRFGKDYYYGHIIIQPDGDIWLYPFKGKTQFKALEGTVSQYIGLNDKNGDEIYLGGKVKGENTPIYTIVFKQGAFCIDLSTEHNNHVAFIELVREQMLTIIDNCIQEIELIKD